MKNHKYLLPHKWQIIGLVTFILSVILLSSLIVYSVFKPENADFRFLEKIIGCIIYLSMVLVFFSEEKDEDVYVQRRRLEIIAICAIICFGIILIMNIIQMFLSAEAYEVFKEWRKENLWNGVFALRASLVYWVIFKLSLIIKKPN